MDELIAVYTIEAASSWPPRGRPSAPYGPTTLEVMRSCALRTCFETSSGYARRSSYAGRVGSTFHRVLQSLSERPPYTRDDQALADEVRERFRRELTREEGELSQRPRERFLPRDPERASRALQAAISEALRMQRDTSSTGSENQASAGLRIAANAEPRHRPTVPGQDAEVEVWVSTRDGLFRGRIDRAERSSAGVHLIDYKAALRDDLPERYERQLQLYAYMWHDERGEWPVQGSVYYPLTGTVHSVAVTQAACQQVVREYQSLLTRVARETSVAALADPGDTCKACEYRPWCRPFWTWQASCSLPSLALERAAVGFEGEIAEISVENLFWRLELLWRNARVQLIAPEERFPQLQQAKRGDTVRVLEGSLRGLRHRPQATITPLTELFVIR